MEILKLLGKQLDSHGIGKKLGLSPRTVDTHSNRIREKLGLPNQQALRDFVLKPTWRNRVRVLQDKPPQADKGWKEDVGRD